MQIKHVLVGACLSGTVAVLTGCASQPPIATRPDPVVQQQREQIASLEDSLVTMQEELTQRERLLEEEKKAAEAARTQDLAGLEQAIRPAGETELLPPGAKPGECYARVFIPPTYSSTTRDVMVHDSIVDYQVTAAQYTWATERVLVKEPTKRIQVVPAQYEWVTEQVIVRPAATRIEQVPAQYASVEEKVLDKPAHTVWKKGRGPIEKIDEATGEIMCLVEVPATYKTVRKRVLQTPATTREVQLPAQYETVRKRVVKTPETTREVEVPAEYQTLRVRKLAKPADKRRIVTPPKYEAVPTRSLAREGRMEWRPILCETNVTRSVVYNLQTALRNAGHNPGPIDGVLGRQTLAAVSSYQRAKGLSRGGLTIETLKSLNVPLSGSDR
jgi:outer membrane murein-binding lipoprotein Lpp